MVENSFNQIIFNKQIISSPPDNHKFLAFLNLIEYSSVAGLAVGILVAARRASLKPIFNSVGILGGGLVLFNGMQLAESENRKMIPGKFIYSNDINRHRQSLFAGAVLGSVGTLFNQGFFAGAQLGVAAATINSFLLKTQQQQ
jgi:hypothetical protein